MKQSRIKWIVGTLIALIAAGSGLLGWKEIFSTKSDLPFKESVTITRSSPQAISKQFSFPENFNLSVSAEISKGIYNPNAGDQGWTLQSGVTLKLEINGTVCSTDSDIRKTKIIHGGILSKASVNCEELNLSGNTQHIVRVIPDYIGSCDPNGGHCDFSELTIHYHATKI